MSTKFTAQEEELLDRISVAVVRRRLEIPAIFMLEAVKPLGFIGSQAMHFFAPMVGALYQGPLWDRTAHLLEKRASIEALIVRIEAAEAQRDDPPDSSER